MEKLSLADINGYWVKANDAATEYELRLQKRPTLDLARKQHFSKNEKVYRLNVIAKIVYTLLIFPFLMAGVYEGIIVAPIFEGIFLVGLADDSSWVQMASYIPMAVLLGLSLATGLCLHNISVKPDSVVPNKRHISWGWIVGGVLGLVLYIGCLYFLTVMAKEEVSGMDNALNLIPVWGGIEIFVGMFAARGFEVLWVHLAGWTKDGRFRRNETKLIRCVQQCNESYYYYRQLVQRWNQLEQPELEENLTPAMRVILSKNTPKMEEMQLQ